MLSYQSQNLESLLHHFGGDSTLVPQIANVKNWSKHRFRQRLWSVCMRWNQWFFPILIKSSSLWQYLHIWIWLVYTKGWLLVLNPEIMILQLYATSKHYWHSFSFTLASSHHKGKKPILLFSLIKTFICDLWLARCLFFTCEKPSNLSQFGKFNTYKKFSLEYISAGI